MPETKRCPRCQVEIPAESPEELCPGCLLQAGLEPMTAPVQPGTAAYTPPGPGFVPPTPEVLQTAFPQLEILELLGKGGMGAVYKAKQRGLDRLVAVKILPPEYSQDPAFAERFQREAKALAQLSHPNIVGVHDIGQAFPSPPAPLPEGASGGYCYFVMEYVDGVNLRQAMRAGQLTPAEALKIVPQICDALQFAHDEGIVHRDIKPENILIDKKGRVKIADFGLAKLLGKTHDVSLTGTQQMMGTLHYMAPEQIEGARDVDHRADIYSLGVTFYEMLTGELPLGRFAAPSKKVQIDVRLDEVVLRSLEKEPEQRYQHASEIKTEVEGIVDTPASAADMDPEVVGKGCAAVFFAVITVISLVFAGVNSGKDNALAGVICGAISFFPAVFLIISVARLARRIKTEKLRRQGDGTGAPAKGPLRFVRALGAALMFCCNVALFWIAYEFLAPPPLPAGIVNDPGFFPSFEIFRAVNTAAKFLIALSGIVCGAGLFLFLPWGRRATVWFALITLAYGILVVPMNFAIDFHGVTFGQEPALVDLLKLSLFWGLGSLIGLTVNIAVLIYLTRPHVFEAGNQKPPPVGRDQAGPRSGEKAPAAETRIVRALGLLNLLAALPLLVFATIELQAVGPGQAALALSDNMSESSKRLNAALAAVAAALERNDPANARVEYENARKVLGEIRTEMGTWKIPERQSARDYYRGYEKNLKSQQDEIFPEYVNLIVLAEDKQLDQLERNKRYESIHQRFQAATERNESALSQLFEAFRSDHITQMLFASRWSYLSAALNYLAGFGLLAAGLGLLRHAPWAWRTIMGIAVVQLLHLLVPFVALMTSSNQAVHLLEAAKTHSWAFFIVVVDGAVILVWLFLLAQIVVLMQDNVRQLFRQLPAAEATASATAPRLFGYLRSFGVPVLVAFGAYLAVFAAAAKAIGEDVALGSAIGAAVLTLAAFWTYRNFGFAFLRPYLPYAWTALCAVLFVLFWTPHESSRAPWSGYVDGTIWPYRHITDCTVTLEPKVATCRSIIIREKSETSATGFEKAHRNRRQPDRDHRIHLTYEIVVQPMNGPARLLTVDGMNGMSCTAADFPFFFEGRGPLNAGTLADWLRIDDAFEEELRQKKAAGWTFDPKLGWLPPPGPNGIIQPDDPDEKPHKIENPEVTQKKRLAAYTLLANNLVDIIQVASRDEFVFYYWADGRRDGSRLQKATHGWGSAMSRRDAFAYDPGANATDSETWQPVVPILYVGAPLMVAVWGVGLWLLRRRRAPRAPDGSPS